jgi:hypothetical protein
LVELERSRGRVYLGGPVSGRHAIALAPGGSGLEYVSFSVNGPDALQRLGALLDREEVAVAESRADAHTGVRDALRFKLPTGHLMELAVLSADGGHGQRRRPAAPGTPDINLNHIQLRAGNPVESLNFLSTIGFNVTDYMRTRDRDGYFAIFTRVNEFHHQIALLAGNVGFHHVALETGAIDVLRFGDHLLLHRVAAEYGPGRHGAGMPIFLYVRDPWGNRIEISSPIEVVGLDRAPRELTDPIPYLINMWGPQPPESWRTDVT